MITTRTQWPQFLIYLIFIGIGLFFLVFSKLIASPQPGAAVLTIHEAIGPATADYVHRGLMSANQAKASLVILQIDTPGGLDNAMRDIIRDILASPIPIVGYVAPSGARAASAGTYILYACHIAAMAPGTNLGAATPISLTGFGEKVEERKATHDAMAYIRSLAELRGRNIPWSEKSITESASLSAPEALKLGVIEVIAADIPDLLHSMNGKTVNIEGKSEVIHTTNLSIQYFNPDWRTQFLSTITNPNVAYILLLIGIYGLFFEFFNPGFILPGVAGVIALLVALYALQLLPVHYAGLALLLFGIAFLVAEAFLPSGVLAIGGLVGFVFGSIMLFETDTPEFHVALSVVLALTITTAVFFLLIIQMAIRSRFRPVVSGPEQLIGKQGEMVRVSENQNLMRLAGEIWQVKSEEVLHEGEMVTVVKREGLTLWVKH